MNIFHEATTLGAAPQAGIVTLGRLAKHGQVSRQEPASEVARNARSTNVVQTVRDFRFLFVAQQCHYIDLQNNLQTALSRTTLRARNPRQRPPSRPRYNRDHPDASHSSKLRQLSQHQDRDERLEECYISMLLSAGILSEAESNPEEPNDSRHENHHPPEHLGPFAAWLESESLESISLVVYHEEKGCE